MRHNIKALHTACETHAPEERRWHTIWDFLRTLATDDAYERYLEHHRIAHANCAPLSRQAFYLREQQRKWSGMQRCC